jgi:hypothetical protein
MRDGTGIPSYLIWDSMSKYELPKKGSSITVLCSICREEVPPRLQRRGYSLCDKHLRFFKPKKIERVIRKKETSSIEVMVARALTTQPATKWIKCIH